MTVPETSAVHCYRCQSRNFTDQSCHDPFTKAQHSLTENCQTAIGTTLFPASHCIKVHGTSGESETEKSFSALRIRMHVSRQPLPV